MTDSLDQITQDIRSCERCELRVTATSPVPGLGRVSAKYFLIGEAPGRDEDIEGIPFVGAAGQKLNKLITLAQIDINDCFIANVCRCRPPDNRTPKKKEIKACLEFLWRELTIVQPDQIITLGSTPLSLFCPYGVTQMHGTQFEFELPNNIESWLSQLNPKAKNTNKEPRRSNRKIVVIEEDKIDIKNLF